jgi:hypothetical protein
VAAGSCCSRSFNTAGQARRRWPFAAALRARRLPPRPGNNRKAAGIAPGALYTLEQAAALVSNARTGRPVNFNTLRRWRREGRLPALERSLGLKLSGPGYGPRVSPRPVFSWTMA